MMKLTHLTVNRLHDHYNYDVQLNPDITFIYGLNGSGKTTILNIIEAIITGRIYNLFDYKFSKIVLQYLDTKSDKSCQISISQKSDSMIVIDNDDKFEIEKLEYRNSYNVDKDTYYLKNYPKLKTLKNRFNYVYVPLNRNIIDNLPMRFRHYQYDEAINKDNISINSTMRQVEALIKSSYNQMLNSITDIDNDFREKMLTSFLNVDDISLDLHRIVSRLVANGQISNTKERYIKILNDFELYSDEIQCQLNKFFESFEEEIIKENWNHKIILQFAELNRIQNLIEVADKYTERKENIRKPIEVFLSIMNDFVSTGDDKKDIYINSLGNVYFSTKYDKNIKIDKLSSGEKQLITFFSNLVFKVKSEKSGIFVVDEPELSLHLSWQRIFVDKILSTNDNLQLIFATHAPEIIGSRRDKMVRLKKEYVE